MELAGVLLAANKRSVDVSADQGVASLAIVGLIGLLVFYFVLRPAHWRRIWFTRVDPRPAALMRIAFGIVVLWSLIDLVPHAGMLFTDEGLWPTALARKRYGGHLRSVWDPQEGFSSTAGLIRAFFSRSSLLHLRSDPPFVFTIYAFAMASIVGVIVGWRTRLMTVSAWFLINSIYNYSPIFYTGGDTVIRVFLFLGMFLRWGEAYSLDSWRRRRAAILEGTTLRLPPLSLIPAWPVRLMMVQLAVVYGTTGAMKNGITWFDGTALYYALNLDHFYRHPAQIPLVVGLQRIGLLPFLTWVTRLWETLFPLVLVGLGLRAFERERGRERGAHRLWGQAGRTRRLLSYACVAGVFLLMAYLGALTTAYYYDEKLSPWPGLDRMTAARIVQASALALPALLIGLYVGLRRRWPRAHAWVLRWLLGRRLWLGLGAVMHVSIELLMNVGTFVQVMLAIYPLWLRGEEVDALWRFFGSRALALGEGDAPSREGLGPKGWLRVRSWLLAPRRRLRHRIARPRFVVVHGAEQASIRRAALLRCWDLCGRLEFEPSAVSAGSSAGAGTARMDLRLRTESGRELVGNAAGVQLCRLLPGLWLLAPLSVVPLLGEGVGWLVLGLLGQRAVGSLRAGSSGGS